MSSFADHPESLTEVRSERSGDAADATPRDALISVLRQLDRGEIAPDVLVVVWREREGSASKMGFQAASLDLDASIGILHRVAHSMGG